MSILDIFRKSKTEVKASNLVSGWRKGTDYADPQDKQSLVDAFKTRAYICVNKNAMTISRQRLRLFLMKKTGQETPAKTMSVSKKDKDWLKANYYDRIRQGISTIGDFEIVELAGHPFLEMMRNINPFYNQTDFLYLTDTFLELTGDSYWRIVKN